MSIRPHILVACRLWVLLTLALAGGDLAALGARSRQLPRLHAPVGAVVFVSTEPELQQAVRALESNTTIMLAPGTYALTRTLTVTGPLANVTVRGASDDPGDVVLTGRGMDNANVEDVPHGIATAGAVAGLTIANLTIRDVFAHAVMLDVGSEAPRIFNVVLANAGRQLIKTFTDEKGGGVDKGTVEYSALEYTAPVNSAGIGGLDVSAGSGWTVRANKFRNIQAGAQLAGPAVLIAHGSSNSVVEQNSFIDCQREIALGQQDRTPDDHLGGVVRNNFISRRATVRGTAAILLADSRNTRVLHNTILANGTSKALIEYRFRDSTGVVVRNNLLDGEVVSLDGASGIAANNYSKATADMFVQPSTGNLHLVSGASQVIDRVAVVPEAGNDFDGDTRPHGATADYGADELRGGSPVSTVPRAGSGSDEHIADASKEIRPGVPLPSPWQVTDVGDPARPASASWWAGKFSIQGSGSDIGGNSDQFGFVYHTLDGDGDIVARLEGLDGPGAPKAGVMIRDELTPGAKYAAALLTLDKDVLFQRRIANGAVTTQTVAASGSASQWVRLVRRGQTLSAFSSADGSRWVPIGSEIVYMNRLLYVGLVVTSRSTRALASVHFTRVMLSMGGSDTPASAAPVTSTGAVAAARVRTNQPPTVSIGAPVHGASYTAPASVNVTALASDSDGTITRVEFFAGSTPIGTTASSPYSVTWRDAPAGTYTLSAKAWDNAGASMISAGINVTIAPASPLPPGWQTADIGSPMAPGKVSYGSERFGVAGAGVDIGERSDQFRFVYQPLDGDGEISACVASLEYVDSWSKAGVMVRETLAADSPYAFALLSAGWGVAFHHRSEPGAKSEQAGVAPGVAPHCLRLVRIGPTVTAYQSVDGRTWVPMGTQSVAMGSSVQIGLAVTSRDATRVAGAVFTHVSVRTSQDQASSVSARFGK